MPKYLRMHAFGSTPHSGEVSVAVSARIPWLLSPLTAESMNEEGDPNGSRSSRSKRFFGEAFAVRNMLPSRFDTFTLSATLFRSMLTLARWVASGLRSFASTLSISGVSSAKRIPRTPHPVKTSATLRGLGAFF